MFDEPAVASVDVRGGGPGTRETELLRPEQTVERVDAIVLSGGSAFGLDAPGGVQAWLREQGRGFAVGPVARADRAGRDPVRPAQRRRQGLGPLSALPRARLCGGRRRRRTTSRSAPPAPGYGATTVNLKGGLGSASAQTRDGATVGAIVAVNAVGSVTVGDGPQFWAAPFEQDGEFGGRGLPAPLPADALSDPHSRAARAQNTTIALVATDAALTKPQANRLAVMAQDGLARAIYPVHTPLDGDIVFAASTGKRPLADPVYASRRARHRRGQRARARGRARRL